MSKDAVSALRAWFNPLNYSVLNNFHLAQVASSLSIRYRLNSWVESGIEITKESCSIYSQILEGDIAGVADSFSGMPGREVIEPLTCEDIYDMSEELQQAGWKPSNDPSNVDTTPFDLYVKERESAELEAGYSSVFINIDLLASDEEILRQLKEFLPGCREALGCPPFNPNTRLGRSSGWQNWVDRAIENRIFQVLDIQLWGKVNKVPIRPSLLSKVVYLDRDSGGSDDDVRKTYLPMARQALNPRRISALWREAYC